MPDRRELYRSPNGDSWSLGRGPTTGHAFIIHQPNAPSGGQMSHIELGEFLRKGNGPEQQVLLRLVGTLADVPPSRAPTLAELAKADEEEAAQAVRDKTARLRSQRLAKEVADKQTASDDAQT